MKKILFVVLSLFVMGGVFAQGTVDTKVRKAADEMIEMYNLDEKQAVTALEIQERRFRNLAEIASLENTNKDLFRHKYKAIQSSTDASLRRMLNEEQMAVYNQRKSELRTKRAAKISELKEQGMTLEEIEYALLKMDEN